MTPEAPRPQKKVAAQAWMGARSADILVVGAITIAGLLMRLPALGLGYWRDEGSTYFDVVPNSLAEMVHRVIYTELSPFGFFLLMYSWAHTIGVEGVLFKIPVLIIGVLLIPAVFMLASSLGSRAVAYTAALVAMISPAAVTFSQEVRPQIVAALLATLTVAAYFKMIGAKDVRPWVLTSFVAGGTALVYVQYTGVLLIFFLGLCSAYLIVQRRADLWPHLAGFAIIGALCLPWLPIMLDHHSVGLPGAGKVDPSNIPFNFLNNLVILLSGPLQGGHRVLMELAILLALAGAAYFIRSFGATTDVKPLVLLGAVALFAFLEAVVIAPVPRYLFIVAPLAWIILALAIVSGFRWAWRLEGAALRAIAIAFLGAALIAGTVLDAHYSLALGQQPKSGVPSLIAFLRSKNLEPSFYVVTPDYIASSVGFYTRNDPTVHLYGFAHWSHPEISTLRGQAALWGSPTIVAEIEAQIKALPRKDGDVFAVVAQEALTQHGGVHTEKSNVFVSDLLKQYHLVGYEKFPGKYESVALYLLATKPHVQSRTDGHVVKG